MLSAEEQKEIAAEIAMVGRPQGASIEALRIVQKHRGWISDEAVRDIALFLGLTAEEVDGAATFYNHIYRRPVGRHVILVCDSVCCWIMGYEKILAHLQSRLGVGLGGTTGDGRFTLLPVVCLGACDRAPAMMVDEDLHGLLDPARIDEILGRYP